MNFKPGDKVWIDVPDGQFVPAGTYPGVAVRLHECFCPGFWLVEIEDISAPPGSVFGTQEYFMRRRDDPPPQQEPKRESVGSWDHCVWKPKFHVEQT